jgi:hypothetical protein
LYILTGLAVAILCLTRGVAFLPLILGVVGLLAIVIWIPVLLLGPSILILCGSTVAFSKTSRQTVCLVASAVLLLALALYTSVAFGWLACLLVVPPTLISLGLASWLATSARTPWIAAITGSAMAAVVLLFAINALIFWGDQTSTIGSRLALTGLAPLLLVALSVAGAFRLRRA